MICGDLLQSVGNPGLTCCHGDNEVGGAEALSFGDSAPNYSDADLEGYPTCWVSLM